MLSVFSSRVGVCCSCIGRASIAIAWDGCLTWAFTWKKPRVLLSDLLSGYILPHGGFLIFCCSFLLSCGSSSWSSHWSVFLLPFNCAGCLLGLGLGVLGVHTRNLHMAGGIIPGVGLFLVFLFFFGIGFGTWDNGV